MLVQELLDIDVTNSGNTLKFSFSDQQELTGTETRTCQSFSFEIPECQNERRMKFNIIAVNKETWFSKNTETTSWVNLC